MNAVVERMQRAQQYLERAAHLEGTGQPVLCHTYVRRASELIEEAREDLAWQRGGFKPFVLAAERLGITAATEVTAAAGVQMVARGLDRARAKESEMAAQAWARRVS